MFVNPEIASRLMPKKGKKAYCATCGKEIKPTTAVTFSSTHSGTVKIHHAECPNENT